MTRERASTIRRGILGAAAAALALSGSATLAQPQDPVKIGFIHPLTGPFASTGRQAEAAARLYMQPQGRRGGGRRIELVLKDDGGVPDQTRRLAQELIANDKVQILKGFGLTPLALAVASIATKAKIPQILTAAATATTTEASPLVVRSSFTLPQ